MAKLSDKEIIVKLQALKKVRPGSIWVDFCREWLDSKINFYEKMADLAINKKEETAEKKIWLPAFGRMFAPAMAMSIVILGSTGLVFASKDTLPGDLLFSIKITFEKAQMSITPISQRAALQIHIANARLKELDKVVADEKKAGNIIEAVRQVNNELTAVKKQLPVMAQNNTLQEAVKIAETATEISNRIPVAIIIDSVCDSFASSSCAIIEKNADAENLPAIQTMEMAEEIIQNIKQLERGSSIGDDENSIENFSQESSDLR